MARLQYQNTAAPDFSASLAGIAQVPRLLAGAADATKGLFAGLQAQQTGIADRILAERALAYQDPASLQAALANGTLIGDQSGRVSVDALAALGNRVGGLTAQGTNLDALTRTRNDNALRDAGKADAAEYLRSSQTGNAAMAKERFNAGGITGLPLADQMELAKVGQNLQQGDLSRATGDHNLFKSLENERRLTELASAQDYVFRNSYDGASALGASQRAGVTDPRVAAALRAGLSSDYPAQFNPGAQSPMMGSAGGGGGSRGGGYTPSAQGTAGTKDGSVYDTTFEFKRTSQPITAMAMGDIQTMQGGMQKTQGHSPLGAFQINKATLEDFAPRVLGADWKNQPFSPENQDKIGEAIFNARKDGNLKGTWAALPDSRPGAYANRSWDDVKGEIAQRETGQSLQSRVNPLITANAVDDVQRANTIANAGNPNRALAALESNLTPRAEIAKALTAEDGTYAGYGQGRVAEQLRQIEARGFNAAQAGQILADSASPRNPLTQAAQILPGIGKNIPSTTWDGDLIEESINRASQMLGDTSATRDRGQVAGAIVAAEDKVSTLRQKAASIRARANAVQSPKLREEADRVEQQLAQAVQSYELLNTIQQNQAAYTTSNLSKKDEEAIAKAGGDPAKLDPDLRKKIERTLASPDLNTAQGRLLNLGNIRN